MVRAIVKWTCGQCGEDSMATWNKDRPLESEDNFTANCHLCSNQATIQFGIDLTSLESVGAYGSDPIRPLPSKEDEQWRASGFWKCLCGRQTVMALRTHEPLEKNDNVVGVCRHCRRIAKGRYYFQITTQMRRKS